MDGIVVGYDNVLGGICGHGGGLMQSQKFALSLEKEARWRLKMTRKKVAMVETGKVNDLAGDYCGSAGARAWFGIMTQPKVRRNRLKSFL